MSCKQSSCFAEMVSDAKKKKAAAKKVNVLKNIVKNETAANKVAEEVENITANGQSDNTNGAPLERQLEEMVLTERTCTGILTSHPQSRDIQFENFSLLFHGHELISDTNLELNYGRSANSASRLKATSSQHSSG